MNLNPNQKKIAMIAGVVLLLVIVGGIAFAKINGSNKGDDTTQEEPTRKKRKITTPVNVIDVSERPYLRLIPKADGRNIEIEVAAVKKAATEAEVLLEYQAGTLLQAVIVNFTLGNLPTSETTLFGSCSAGGACTYHTDIQGGALEAVFTGTEDYAVKSDWNYLEAGPFTSKDEKMTITGSSLTSSRFVVVYNSPGYPEGLEGTPASDPYTVAGSSALTGTATVSIESESGTSIMGWNGSSWTPLETTKNGSSLTASGEVMDLYIAVE